MTESYREYFESPEKADLYDGTVLSIREAAIGHPRCRGRSGNYERQIAGSPRLDLYGNKYLPWIIGFNNMHRLFVGDAQIELINPVEGDPDARNLEVYTFHGDRISWLNEITIVAPGGNRSPGGYSTFEDGFDLDIDGYRKLRIRINALLAE